MWSAKTAPAAVQELKFCPVAMRDRAKLFLSNLESTLRRMSFWIKSEVASWCRSKITELAVGWSRGLLQSLCGLLSSAARTLNGLID